MSANPAVYASLYDTARGRRLRVDARPTHTDPARCLLDVALKGRGTIAELNDHLASVGYRTTNTGWTYLSGADELRRRVVRL